MAPQTPAKDDAIVIVGSGIFGLSTALHLARRGYTNVTVLDKQPYDKTLYSYLDGADAASADINKIMRSAYGGQTEYQELSTEAIAEWIAWNSELAGGKTLPPGMTREDVLFVQNGNLSMSTAPELPEWELACIRGMEKMGIPDTQLATTDARHRAIAQKKGMWFGIDPFQREARGKSNVGVLDITGGMVLAGNACRFALQKARLLGAKFVFGPEQGHFDSLCYQGNQVVGVKTRDGKTHPAVMTIMACGGWTPVLVPQLDGLCEATAGSVAMLKIPQTSTLWDRLAPSNFPTWTWDMRNGAAGGLYGFPRDKDGWLKVGYRGTKYTNPVVQGDGKERSTPATRWSAAHRDGKDPVGDVLTSFPRQAHKIITTFLDNYLPEIAAEGVRIEKTRICWYTDTFDNHFIVDRVPDVKGLMVASGGSGHAFKYLPNIGNWVVDIMEGVNTDRQAVQAWRWRQTGEAKPVNDLMQGSKGDRALGNIPMLKEAAVTAASRANL